MIANKYSVYILTNKRNTVLYIGMTNNLKRRVKYHKGKYKGSTAKYNIVKLVYYEPCENKTSATKRERQLKNLLRRKKISLINRFNPSWLDLHEKID